MAQDMTNATTSDSSQDWSIYPYQPNKALPIVFAVIVSLAGVLQVYQSFRRSGWFIFGRFMTFATLVWLAGFITRALSVRLQQNVTLFIVQYVMILAGPPLYGAAEFFILGRLLAYLPYHAPMHPGRVVCTFIFLDAVVESLTGTGASISASNIGDPTAQMTGARLLQAALILQCVVEAGFFSVVAITEVRCRRAGQLPRHVHWVILLLYVTSFMLLVRGILRAVEAFETASCIGDVQQFWCGYISLHEWPLWVFEVGNISLFVILLAVFHPSRFLPSNNQVYLDPTDGKTERLGPGYSDFYRRAVWTTVLDPFNFGAIIFGRGADVAKFWEDDYPIYHGKAGEKMMMQEKERAASSKA